jgi:D-3-phosphoglycerate dehydrogenase
MLGMMSEFEKIFSDRNVEVHCPDVVQTLSEEELISLVPKFDGWIIGDDPATRSVFEAGSAGKLKAAVKWGIGVDNVDFTAAKDLDIPIINTPDMFGAEVADVAMCYVTGLARHLFDIDADVKKGDWPKPRGISLSNKTVALIGFGDIGKNTAQRMLAAQMQVIAYDPVFTSSVGLESVENVEWPSRLDECDFIVFTCSLTESNHHMFNEDILGKIKSGVRIVNVARGPLISDEALINGMEIGKIHSVALDVVENEPLPKDSRLREFDHCIFGSHNASNTSDAVSATSKKAINILFEFLGVK